MSKRLVYLAGCIEVDGDTWRKKAAETLKGLGFDSIDPLRNEEFIKIGKHIESDLSDKQIVRRDLDDLKRVGLSGGLILANLNTAANGRTPIGTLFELMFGYDNNIPIIAVMGKDTDVNIRTHPWTKYCVTYEATSLKDALGAIEKYFK